MDPPWHGSWAPDVDALKDLAIAIAKRYSGNTADPLLLGSDLPRIRYVEAWNEPNYKMYLTPQYEKVRGRLTLTLMDRYRTMLNAVYAGYKSIQPDSVVLSAGLGPYGDSSGGKEIQPQLFMRGLLCLSKFGNRLTVAPKCPVKATFDVFAHHPYTLFGTPTTKAYDPDGGALGNVAEMVKAVNFAVAKKTVLPDAPKPFWVTEFGWLTNPPGIDTGSKYRVGVIPKLAGIYTSEVLYRFWAWGVSTAIWYHALDASDWPGGLYFTDPLTSANTPKPSGIAMRFPMFARTYGTGLRLWAKSPCANLDIPVTFLASRRGRWQPVATQLPDSSGIVLANVDQVAGAKGYRASVSSEACSAQSLVMPVYRR
jgi:hypothetical protein